MVARNSTLFAMVLAAGGSRRLGEPKQLLTRGGETLVQRTLRLAAGACANRTLLVLGSEHARVLAGASDSVRYFVVNERWEAGLSGSLTLGLECLPGNCAGVLVLLADQPLIDREDLARLTAAWREQPSAIAASRYAGVLGVPAIFPRRHFGELQALEGDQGARPVIERHRDDVVAVDCAHAAVDIDTPADAAALESDGRR